MSLQITRLTKKFGTVTAVNNLDLQAHEGEFVSVVGPSGCGKTTLLRMIAGLEAPDRGRVSIKGRDVTSLAPEARNVGIVFQNYALFPHMTVAANVAYGLRRQKLGRPAIDRRVSELLEMVGLPSLGTRRPSQLSAGQQQRVALARALAPRPQTLLLDEPLSALDASLRDHLRSEIRRMQRLFGITTIFVTHDQEEALAMSDRVAVMHEGQIEQMGDPWSLYDQPQSEFVARFIGRGNFLSGLLDSNRADLGRVGAVSRQFISETVPNGPVLAVVRPESMQISEVETAKRQPEALSFTAAVQDVTFGGERCTVYLQGENDTWLAALPGASFSHLRNSLGKRVLVTIPFSSLRWVERR